MYKTRDPEFQLCAHPGACFRHVPSKNDATMAKILIPPEDISGYGLCDLYPTIMVRIEQVRTASPDLNIIYMNTGADITLRHPMPDGSVKDAPTRPEELLGRWLKWYRHERFAGRVPDAQLNLPSIRMYEDFRDSRMGLAEYVNRLPMTMTI